MNWEIATFALLAWALGLMMGLSLGFRVGTKRTILLFQKHFPNTRTLNALVSMLIKASDLRKPDEIKR